MIPDEAVRPDPDALLAQIASSERKAQRGRLKIFFGASAGVGKTFAMLSAAAQAQAQGQAVIVGLVETHGRRDTEAVAQPLLRLERRPIEYRGRTLLEFDLQAALDWATDHPGGLVLVDELAHSNAPGSRHPKRWQDALELLDAGVDVWSTMNVQHLESLNDIVNGITGVQVWETVPDHVFDAADEVVVVDLPPDELLQRLAAGKVYLPQQAERAAQNFFRKGNLLALRELALRRTADRVDHQMQVFRRSSAPNTVWPTREALLACIGRTPDADKVVRSCARLASQLDVPWHAVFVEAPGASPDAHADPDRQIALGHLKLARELGATVATLHDSDVVRALIGYAREHNLVRIVMGRSPTRWPWQRSLAERLAHSSIDLDVMQVAVTADRRPPAAMAVTAGGRRPVRWSHYGAAAALCAITALVATPLMGLLELSNIVMLFLLTVVVTALRFGRGPAVLSAVLGVALFDFFFVPPRWSFAVQDVEYLVTFGVMLTVALVVGQLTAGLKAQAVEATTREGRMTALYAMARDLSASLQADDVATIAAGFLSAQFGARSALLVPDENGHLPRDAHPALGDLSLAQWVLDHQSAAGRGTDTLPQLGVLLLPLKAPMRIRGVLAVQAVWTGLLDPEQRRLLDTCASLVAMSLERLHYVDVAQKSTLQIESERLRNSLLSAVSHDLRTPLTALVGLADTLQMTQPVLSAQQQEIAASIRASASRMHALVVNLLDMARLQAGAVQLHLAWMPWEEVIGAALASCKELLGERKVQVTTAPGFPLLQIDAVLMERVMVNLIENACRYAFAHTALRIEAGVVDEQAQIIVDDRGPGLPAGRESAIFEKFERGAKESTSGGVGLGLAISRAIVQAHGGTLIGENRIEAGLISGARFVLRLPLAAPPADDGSQEAPIE